MAFINPAGILAALANWCHEFLALMLIGLREQPSGTTTLAGPGHAVMEGNPLARRWDIRSNPQADTCASLGVSQMGTFKMAMFE